MAALKTVYLQWFKVIWRNRWAAAGEIRESFVKVLWLV